MGMGSMLASPSNMVTTSPCGLHTSLHTTSAFADHTLLLVDDGAVIRKLMAMQLRSMGFREENIMLARSGRQALEMFRARPSSVVLTDHHIGTGTDLMHGPELVSALRAHQNTWLPKRPLVIIGITGDLKVQQWEGVNHILQKPFGQPE